VLLNGAPGSGKSTLARRWVADHPLALALDVDAVRGMLGDWLADPVGAGLAARALALAMAGTHLAAGRDVVVPQFLGRLDFVLALEQAAADAGARFVEVALLSDAEDVVRRFVRRSGAPETAEHRDAAALQELSGGAAGLREAYERLLAVVAARPGTRVVHTADGEVDRAARDLAAAIGPP
jgi:predicted kinase